MHRNYLDNEIKMNSRQHVLKNKYTGIPDSWHLRSLTDALKDISSGWKKLQKHEILKNGNIPVVDQGQEFIAGYTNDFNVIVHVNKPVIIFGDHTRIVKYINFKFAVGADGVKILEPKDDVDSKYLFHYLNHLEIPNAGYSRHYKYLKDEFIPLPLLPEQRRIAAILDKADEIRKKRQQALALCDEFLKSTFLDMFGDLSNIDWRNDTLGKSTYIDSPMVDPRIDVYTDLLHIGPDRIEKNTGTLLPALTAREEKLISKKFLFDQNHVLYSKIRPNLKKVALPNFKGLCSADMYPVRPNPQKITREFLWMLLLSDSFTNYTQTLPGRANIPKLNKSEFANFSFRLPPLPLQQKFAAAVEKTEAMKAHLKQSIAESENLFNSLSQRAFKGEL